MSLGGDILEEYDPQQTLDTPAGTRHHDPPPLLWVPLTPSTTAKTPLFYMLTKTVHVEKFPHPQPASAIQRGDKRDPEQTNFNNFWEILNIKSRIEEEEEEWSAAEVHTKSGGLDGWWLRMLGLRPPVSQRRLPHPLAATRRLTRAGLSPIDMFKRFFPAEFFCIWISLFLLAEKSIAGSQSLRFVH